VVSAMPSADWMEQRLRTISPEAFESLCVYLMATVDEYKRVYQPRQGFGRRDQGIDARVDHPNGEMRVWFCFSTQQDWWKKCRTDVRKYDDSLMRQVQEVVFCFNAKVDRHEVYEREKNAESLVCKLANHEGIRVRIFTMRELLDLLRRKEALQIAQKFAFGFRATGGTLIWDPVERLRSSIELLDKFHIGPRRSIVNEVYQIHLGLWGLLEDVAQECWRKDLGPTGDHRLAVLLNYLACLCVSQGDRESAYKHLVSALGLLPPGPGQACVLSNLVKICSEMRGHRTEAVKYFKDLRKLFGSSEELQLPRNVPFLQLGWATELGDPGQGYWTLGDRVVVPFRYAGYAHLYVGKTQEAKALFERSVMWQGRRNCSPDSLLGLAYIHQCADEDSDCQRLVDEVMRRLGDEGSLGRDGARLQYEACAETYACRYDKALRLVEKLKQVEPERLHYICDEPHYESLRRHFGHEFREVVGNPDVEKA
jgi:tetratricopeptide (TPR) repeat protein